MTEQMTMQTFIWGGFGLLSAWTALARSGGFLLTAVLRLAVSLMISGGIYMLLFGTHGMEMVVTVYVMFVSVPVVLGTFVFDIVRSVIGTALYIALVAVCSAALIAFFITHLNS